MSEGEHRHVGHEDPAEDGLPAQYGHRPGLEHPVEDPEWLRHDHRACLWDGAPQRPDSQFCSEECEAVYQAWLNRTEHTSQRREPAAPDPDEGGTAQL